MNIFSNFAAFTTMLLTSKWVILLLLLSQMFLSARSNHKKGLIIPAVYAVHMAILLVFSLIAFFIFDFDMKPTLTVLFNETALTAVYMIIYFVSGIKRRDRKRMGADKIDIKNL